MIRFGIVKRKPLPGWAKIVIPIAAILATLILSAIPILLVALVGFSWLGGWIFSRREYVIQ